MTRILAAFRRFSSNCSRDRLLARRDKTWQRGSTAAAIIFTISSLDVNIFGLPVPVAFPPRQWGTAFRRAPDFAGGGRRTFGFGCDRSLVVITVAGAGGTVITCTLVVYSRPHSAARCVDRLLSRHPFLDQPVILRSQRIAQRHLLVLLFRWFHRRLRNQYRTLIPLMWLGWRFWW